MIILVSHGNDQHATEVLGQLAERGADALLFDTARVPREVRLAVAHEPDKSWRADAVIDGHTRDLTGARVVWWRRPMPFRIHDEIRDADDQGFAYGECHAAMAGLWTSLDAVWINNPDRDEAAARKAWQLKVANALGFRIPRTCITNDPDRARAFVAAEGGRGTIYKAFSATERSWRETRLLKPDEQALLDRVRYAPVIFQEYIDAKVDLRITVVGDDIFPAEIGSQETSYRVDFRMTMHEADIRPHVLPPDVAAKIGRLMRALGLVYGAIDMRLTPEGEYVFLEINPAGQWLFVEQRTGQPITATLARHMIAHDGGAH
jgi:glutathione synthase/RimK-type ligase-like ATP-grasp enzyme